MLPSRELDLAKRASTNAEIWIRFVRTSYIGFAIGNSTPPEDVGPFPPPLASVRYMAVMDGELLPVVRCACVSKLFVLQPPQYRHLTDKRPYQGRFSDASGGRRGPG